MRVQEKTRHIDAAITGIGLEAIRALIVQNMPGAVITDDEESVNWENSELAQNIRVHKTPGKLLRAYRERAGLSIVELAGKAGVKYTNISAMEHDNRVIGLAMARRLSAVLNCDYTKFLNP
jgi:plasmid maintenance system antidote protein VapI